MFWMYIVNGTTGKQWDRAIKDKLWLLLGVTYKSLAAVECFQIPVGGSGATKDSKIPFLSARDLQRIKNRRWINLTSCSYS